MSADQPTDRGPSGVRAPGERLTVEERVTAIARMMREGEWVSGKSDRELSEVWGFDANTIRRAAAEASRRVRHERNLDAGAERHTVLDLLDEAAEMAREEGGAKGAKAMQAIARTRAEVSGLLSKAAPVQVNVDARSHGAAVPSWQGALDTRLATALPARSARMSWEEQDGPVEAPQRACTDTDSSSEENDDENR